MIAVDLLPCPFCGGKASHNDGGNSVYGRLWWGVWCDECQFEMRDQEVWSQAGNGMLDPAYPAGHCIAAWHRRAPVSAGKVNHPVEKGV